MALNAISAGQTKKGFTMKRFFTIILIATVAALALCLVGCGSSSSSKESTVTVTPQNGKSETYSGNEFSRMVKENEALADKYKGAQIDTTAHVVKVDNSIVYNDHQTDGGYVILDNGISVEYSKSDIDIISSLKKGDTVNAKGYIFFIDDEGIKVLNNNVDFRFRNGFVLSPQIAKIQKL